MLYCSVRLGWKAGPLTRTEAWDQYLETDRVVPSTMGVSFRATISLSQAGWNRCTLLYSALDNHFGCSTTSVEDAHV